MHIHHEIINIHVYDFMLKLLPSEHLKLMLNISA